MDKIKKVLKKISYCFLSFVGVIVLLRINLLKKIIFFMIEMVKSIIYFFMSKQFASCILAYFNIEVDYTWMKAIISYLGLCIFSFCIKMVILIFIIPGLENLFSRVNRIVLGKNHERSLEYTTFQIWFLKLSADLSILTFWIRKHMSSFVTYGKSDFSMVKKAKLFTIETINCFWKDFFKFFFHFSIINLIFFVDIVYIYYFSSIQNYFSFFVMFLKNADFSITILINNIASIVKNILLVYVFFDIRHKAIGYSEIRKERFKELIQMEEKFLSLIIKIHYLLETNIEIIVDRKLYILLSGAKSLTGKDCYIYDGKIIYEDREYSYNFSHEDKYFQLRNLMEMENEFDSLKKMSEELKKSPLNYSNIYLIDKQTKLIDLMSFSHLERESSEYKKMQLFCKSSMEKWFENYFIEPTIYTDEEKYYSEENATEIVLDASRVLDFELINAFKLEAYLVRYKKKLLKRLKHVNRISRFYIG